MSDIITRTLYRSLLRTTKPFASPYNGPILCSLLYRLGLDDDEYLDNIRFGKLQKRTDASTDTNTNIASNQEEGSKSTFTKSTFSILQPTSDHNINISTSTASKESHSSSFKDVHLSKEEARDLTKTYDELRKIHFDKESRGLTSSSLVDNDYNDSDTWSTIYNQDDLDDDDDNNNNQITKSTTSQNYLHLYKHLLRQLFLDEQENVLRQMQFPSQTTKRTEDKDDENKYNVECIMGKKLINLIQNEFRDKSNSNIYTSAIKRETGFLVLRELQKKLLWAQSMGIHDDLFHYHEHTKNIGDIGAVVYENEMKRRMDEERYIQIQAANDVNRISTKSSSLFLQSGVFLIAHPMLRGIFDRSVICILQHTERKKMESNLEGFEEEEQSDDDDDDTDMDISAAQNGGTYGVIINSPLTVGIPGSDSRSGIRRRNRTLREVIRNDSLPEGVRLAFGDSPVRNGGPVNLSIQMLRYASPEDEEKLKIGGIVLPQVLVNDDVSTAMYSDKAIYFGGDIIKAAQAVLDGDMERGMFLCIFKKRSFR